MNNESQNYISNKKTIKNMTHNKLNYHNGYYITQKLSNGKTNYFY